MERDMPVIEAVVYQGFISKEQNQQVYRNDYSPCENTAGVLSPTS